MESLNIWSHSTGLWLLAETLLEMFDDALLHDGQEQLPYSFTIWRVSGKCTRSASGMRPGDFVAVGGHKFLILLLLARGNQTRTPASPIPLAPLPDLPQFLLASAAFMTEVDAHCTVMVMFVLYTVFFPFMFVNINQNRVCVKYQAKSKYTFHESHLFVSFWYHGIVLKIYIFIYYVQYDLFCTIPKL